MWQGRGVGLAVVALALLAGTPAAFAAAGVGSPWVLGGATGLAAVVAALGAVWQERYRRLAQRRDEQAFRIEDGCLVLADGRLPAVRDITDPVLLGVHRAPPTALPAGMHHPGNRAGEHGPAYVPRDVDADLRERLAEGGFVLLVGDSTAGKSRAAFEAMTATLPGDLLISPAGRDAVTVAVAHAAQARRCVLWLDDLEDYLGTGGLTAAQVGRLLTGGGHHRVIMATLRAAEQARITADGSSSDGVDRRVLRDSRQILDQAHAIRVPRMFSEAELGRARIRDWDPRVAEALRHADTYGIAEYLAAGPELLREWEDARDSSHGPNARGAALVAAAIDIRRAGYISPIPRALLDQIHEYYLDDPGHARVPREPSADAWEWATRLRLATTVLLRPTANGRLEVFDYLLDTVQRRSGPADHVPAPVVRAAIGAAKPADADSLAATAYAQGRYAFAEHGWRQAWQARVSNPEFGAEHPDTLNSRESLADALQMQGRLKEAEAENRAVLEIRTRALGPEHPATLLSRDHLALVLGDRGKPEEAEAGHRAVLEIRTRVLGPEHPDTLTSRNNHALFLRDLGRLTEAEAEHRAVLDIRTRVLGSEHPRTLTSRNNRAMVLRLMRRIAEADAEHRAVLEIRTRVLGAEHPDTLTSRNHLAMVLRYLGRLEEAEAEHRAVLDIRTHLLGPQHPDTMTSLDNVAGVLGDMGRLEEAAAGHQAAMEIRSRVLGPQHPSTLVSRDNLAKILRDLERPGKAEAADGIVPPTPQPGTDPSAPA